MKHDDFWHEILDLSGEELYNYTVAKHPKMLSLCIGMLKRGENIETITDYVRKAAPESVLPIFVEASLRFYMTSISTTQN